MLTKKEAENKKVQICFIMHHIEFIETFHCQRSLK